MWLIEFLSLFVVVQSKSLGILNEFVSKSDIDHGFWVPINELILKDQLESLNSPENIQSLLAVDGKTGTIESNVFTFKFPEENQKQENQTRKTRNLQEAEINNEDDEDGEDLTESLVKTAVLAHILDNVQVTIENATFSDDHQVDEDTEFVEESTTQGFQSDEKLANAADFPLNGENLNQGIGVDNTKFLTPWGHLFTPIKDKFHHLTALITHPNIGIPTLIKKPVQFWQKLQEKGSDLFHGANGAIFGAGQYVAHDYPFPYRKAPLGLVKDDVQGPALNRTERAARQFSNEFDFQTNATETLGISEGLEDFDETVVEQTTVKPKPQDEVKTDPYSDILKKFESKKNLRGKFFNYKHDKMGVQTS